MTLLSPSAPVVGLGECHALIILVFSTERRPVTPKIAGSSPAAPAMNFASEILNVRFRVLATLCVQDPAQVRFTECDHVVETLPSQNLGRGNLAISGAFAAEIERFFYR